MSTVVPKVPMVILVAWEYFIHLISIVPTHRPNSDPSTLNSRLIFGTCRFLIDFTNGINSTFSNSVSFLKNFVRMLKHFVKLFHFLLVVIFKLLNIFVDLREVSFIRLRKFIGGHVVVLLNILIQLFLVFHLLVLHLEFLLHLLQLLLVAF